MSKHLTVFTLLIASVASAETIKEWEFRTKGTDSIRMNPYQCAFLKVIDVTPAEKPADFNTDLYGPPDPENSGFEKVTLEVMSIPSGNFDAKVGEKFSTIRYFLPRGPEKSRRRLPPPLFAGDVLYYTHGFSLVPGYEKGFAKKHVFLPASSSGPSMVRVINGAGDLEDIHYESPDDRIMGRQLITLIRGLEIEGDPLSTAITFIKTLPDDVTISASVFYYVYLLVKRREQTYDPTFGLPPRRFTSKARELILSMFAPGIQDPVFPRWEFDSLSMDLDAIAKGLPEYIPLPKLDVFARGPALSDSDRRERAFAIRSRELYSIYAPLAERIEKDPARYRGVIGAAEVQLALELCKRGAAEIEKDMPSSKGGRTLSRLAEVFPKLLE